MSQTSEEATLPRYRIKVDETWHDVDVGELSTALVRVRVDGEEYLVEVEPEEVRGAGATAPPVRESPTPPPVRPTPPPPPAPPPPAPAGVAGALRAPMPGIIVRVLVAVGDAVVRGQDLCILEAMKMQQSIKTPRDGVVSDVSVVAGQRVAAGDTLLVVKGE